MAVTRTRDALAELAGRLAVRTPAISEELTKLLLDSIEVFSVDEFAHERMYASAQANVSTFTHLLRHPGDLDAVEVPLAAMQLAHWLAQRGLPLTALLRAYYLAGARMSSVCLLELIQIVDHSDQLAPALEQTNSLVHGYIDRLCERISPLYNAERERWQFQQGAARLEKIQGLLSGQRVDVSKTESTLGYSLAGSHLGVVAWHSESNLMGNESLHVQRLIETYAARLGCRQAPLIVARDEATAWGWLPLTGVVRPNPVAELLTCVESDQQLRIAVGEPAVGIDGFVRTHNQAMSAQTVALAAGDHAASVTPYRAVASIAFLCQDLDRAREWVIETLGGLCRDDDSTEQLRRTLATFLDCGRSFTASAERLQCHKNTVQYRIRRAEGLCGRPLGDRQLDLELALSACRWLGPVVFAEASAYSP
jgi:DNA-binding PucR family transcriptional regulator